MTHTVCCFEHARPVGVGAGSVTSAHVAARAATRADVTDPAGHVHTGQPVKQQQNVRSPPRQAGGSSLVDRVCEYCMSHGFDADFETYMTENAAVFLDAVDAAAGSEAIEHKLEYQECFDRFLAIFEV